MVKRCCWGTCNTDNTRYPDRLVGGYDLFLFLKKHATGKSKEVNTVVCEVTQPVKRKHFERERKSPTSVCLLKANFLIILFLYGLKKCVYL